MIHFYPKKGQYWPYLLSQRKYLRNAVLKYVDTCLKVLASKQMLMIFARNKVQFVIYHSHLSIIWEQSHLVSLSQITDYPVCTCRDLAVIAAVWEVSTMNALVLMCEVYATYAKPKWQEKFNLDLMNMLITCKFLR